MQTHRSLANCLKAFRSYTQEKKTKRLLYEKALQANESKQIRPALVQMLKVGIYWRQIKGRFSRTHSRTYLAMKYGYRWLSKVKMRKLQRQKHSEIAAQEVKPRRKLQLTSESVTDNVRQLLITSKVPALPVESSQEIGFSRPRLDSQASVVSNTTALYECDSRLSSIEQTL